MARYEIPEGWMDVSIHFTLRIKDSPQLREVADAPPPESWLQKRGRRSVRDFVKGDIEAYLEERYADNGIEVEVIHPGDWEKNERAAR